MIPARLFGAAAVETTESVSITDNEILDEFEFPFGNWIKETVDWANDNFDPVFTVIRAPFDAVLTVVVDWFFLGLPWYVIVLFIGLLGMATRNVKVGLLSAAGIAFCGILGNDFWDPTAKTIGMIATAVIICAAVGIPLGILCGRVDAAWNVVRPLLDGMQVVHPFVYLLPVIFFFGIGTAPGVMVTMVFALPPIVRLTNLGIRQVPEDVVEAARSYGAPESRVLVDVQLPLARAAILTGLNQTLLMAVSMVGIIALMAAGGLGQMVFRGVQNLNIPLAASSGLALYIVAVVMDRISQPEGTQGGMAARLVRGWMERRDPERLMQAVMDDEVGVDPDALVVASSSTHNEEGHPTAVGSRERLGGTVAVTGAVVVFLAAFLPWSTSGAPISTYPRPDDAALTDGMSGLTATGGSWFGWFMVFAAVLLVASSLGIVLGRAKWIRSLGPETAMASGASLLILSVSYLAINPSGFIDSYQRGSGAYVAVLGGLAAFLGAALRLHSSPFRPRRVPPSGVRWGQIVAVGFAAILIVGGAVGSWIYDERTESVLTPEIQERIDELRDNAETPAEQAAAASEIAGLLRSDSTARVTTGFGDDGPRLGLPFLVFGLAAVALGLLAAIDSVPNRWKWNVNAMAFGLGVGSALIPLAWTVSVLRVAPARYYSGAGCFAGILGGALLAAAVAGSFSNYFRRMEWGTVDMLELDEDASLREGVDLTEIATAEPTVEGSTR